MEGGYKALAGNSASCRVVGTDMLGGEGDYGVLTGNSARCAIVNIDFGSIIKGV